GSPILKPRRLMMCRLPRGWSFVVLGLLGGAAGCQGPSGFEVDGHAALPADVKAQFLTPPADLPAPATNVDARPLPITLATALQLAGAQPYVLVLASERIELAAAELERAQALWLPTLYVGGDYYRHDGQL